MNWASRRRFFYISGVTLFFAVIIGVPFVLWIYEPATCFDGKLNQGEFSIDRGGPCKLLDARQLTPHSVLWARPFMARTGVHSAVAYIENPNQKAGVLEAPYRMKIYDERNVLIAEREGITPVMPGTITPIFEGELMSGQRTAARAFFEFATPLVWEKMEDHSQEIIVSDKKVINNDTEPRASAVITNDDVVDYRNVTIVAVVFDTAGNAFAASQTVIPLLEKRVETPITFTWSEPFNRRVARVDILPVVDPID
jgi:hypothetical protein